MVSGSLTSFSDTDALPIDKRGMVDMHVTNPPYQTTKTIDYLSFISDTIGWTCPRIS